jgi:hypothetical protein
MEANAARAMRTWIFIFPSAISTRASSAAETYSKSRKMSTIPQTGNLNIVKYLSSMLRTRTSIALPPAQ